MERTARWRRGVAVGVATVAATVATIVTPVAQRAVASPTPADVVVEWNAHAQTAIIGTAAQGPTVAYLHLAMVQGAVYDAVNAIEGGYEPYLGSPAMADAGDSTAAAAATGGPRRARRDVPGPAGRARRQADDDARHAPRAPARRAGSRSARPRRRRCSSARDDDGRFSSFTVIQGSLPGEWRSTAFLPDGSPVVEPAPWVGNVTPFLVPDVEALRSKGPNPLTSDAYARDFEEVKRLGSLTSTKRTADQTEAAIFWQATAPCCSTR